MKWSEVLDLLFPAQCVGCNGFGSGLCAACEPARASRVTVALDGVEVTAFGWYEGVLRAAILAVKDGRRDVAHALGERIAPSIATGATLVPIPTTRARRRVRGFDGVCCIARAAAQIAGARVVEALAQPRGHAQRGRSRDERLTARNRFTCATSLRGVGVILIDDVCTTGATLADCSRAVRQAGGRVEGAVVVAATKADRRGS